MREVDDDVAGLERRLRIRAQGDTLGQTLSQAVVAGGLEGGPESKARLVREGGADTLSHASQSADDDDAGRGFAHSRPRSFITICSRSRLGAVSGVSGSRISSRHRPRMATAAFTGMGFVSVKSASKRGSSW